MTKSFFEYLGLADVERIHSQFLAWIFSTDCSGIDQQERNILLKNIFNVNGEINDIQTERNSIDILISTSTDIIVVENKIKSSQHSNQLDNYKRFCDKEFPEQQKHYFFLTLIDEKTNNKDWKGLTYSVIFKHLSALKLKANNNHSSIINEYLIFLRQLEIVVLDFTVNAIDYDIVFLDGKKKKQDKKRSDYKTENEWFIASNQLETILQKSYLNILIGQINNPTGIINETRGDALVDFPLQRDIEFEGRKYFTDLQLQGQTVKFIFVIQSESTLAIQGEAYSKSEKSWIKNIIPLMSKLRTENKFNYKRLNEPKDFAYISISKKIDEQYWHKSIDDFTEFIQTEIKHCKEMTRQLKQLLTT